MSKKYLILKKLHKRSTVIMQLTDNVTPPILYDDQIKLCEKELSEEVLYK